jgi:hypothetical protein
MKKCIIAVAAICLLSISAYADHECDTKYHAKLKKLKSLSGTEISEEAKNKYISQLEKAYQLCQDGKKEQAAEVWAELNEEHDFDTVFSTHDGN